MQKDKRIGFAHAIDLNLVAKSKAKCGDFVIGSTLSHQLLPLESHITVITNIEHDQQNTNSQHDYIHIPLSFLSDEIAPIDWGFKTYRGIMFLDSIKVEENDYFEIEQKIILQSNSSAWFNLRKNQITSSNAHKILIRKKNFDTLADEFFKPEMEKKLPKVVKDALKHGKLHEPTAGENYNQYLKFVLKYDINVR